MATGSSAREALEQQQREWERFGRTLPPEPPQQPAAEPAPPDEPDAAVLHAARLGVVGILGENL